METKTITNYDLDMLGEIGNIGAGNAATALSLMLNKTVLLEIPFVKICSSNKIKDFLCEGSYTRTGVFFQVSQGLNGLIAFVLEDIDVKLISNLTAEGYEIDHSAVITEVSNIISGSYVGSIASMMNETLELSIPKIVEADLDTLIKYITSEIDCDTTKVIIIGTKLIIDNEYISASFIFLLNDDSLNKLLKYFNGK